MKKLNFTAMLVTVSFMTACSVQENNKAEDGLRIWSDTPAYTCVMENQRELCATSDIDDGLFEGDTRPELPRVKSPSKEKKTWHSGEGTDYLHEETQATTKGLYPNPVRLWEAEAYPIGNGRMAASVFNGSGRDRYALNETSYWSGGQNKGTINLKGDKRYNGGQGPDATEDEFGGDQPVGDLIVDFGSAVEKGSFCREVMLDKGMVHACGKRHGVTVESYAFISHPDEVMVARYSADKPGGLHATLTMALQRPNDQLTIEQDAMVMRSELKNGMKCVARILVRNHGGSLERLSEGIVLSGADSLDLIVAVETNYVMDFDKNFRGEEPETKIAQRMKNIENIPAAAIMQRHVSDYTSLYDRMALTLPASPDSLSAMPTYKRLAHYKQTQQDTGLEETIFNFGRYLMISTSRGGNLPAGLQGIWNSMVNAPWGNDYHSNINLQMVYWLPEVANLSECHMSMIDYLWAMRKPNQMATTDYLKAIGEDASDNEGWIVYTSHNPFGGNGWQVNLPGSAWYGLHIWEHYAFTQDKQYLKEKGYPMLRELSIFWMKHLKALGKGGKGFVSNYEEVDVTQYPELADIAEGTLVVPLGWSPEHGPRGEDGVAHDQEIIRELFEHTIEAADVLGVDLGLADSLKQICSRMYFPRIGKKGNLMEWMIDRDPLTEHRHTSHLFAVYPGSTITPTRTPELAEAAKQSLLFRKNTGESRTSWAWTWRSMLWNRLRDGNKGHEMMEGLICHNMLDNLFTSHKIPLQIDGNYGVAACMIEMLVQSHEGVITLLPALCNQWQSGKIRGVKTRGGITVDMTWKDGRVTDWKLRAAEPKEATVVVNGESIICQVSAE